MNRQEFEKYIEQGGKLFVVLEPDNLFYQVMLSNLDVMMELMLLLSIIQTMSLVTEPILAYSKHGII